MKVKVCFLSFVLCICASNAARILAVMPLSAKSHFYFHEALFSSLAKNGHHITLVSRYSLGKPMANFTIIKPPAVDENPLAAVAVKNTGIIKIYQHVIDVQMSDCEDVLKMPFIKNLLKSGRKDFDVLFVELFFMYECYLPIADKLGIPVIGTMSASSIAMIDSASGNPRNPAVKPFEIAPLGLKMTFSQRIQNLIFHLVDKFLHAYLVNPTLSSFYAKHYPDFDKSQKKVSLFFVNSQPAFEPRPLVPSLINVGGIHLEMSTTQQLPKDFQKFVDEAKHGVILFSLGSIATGTAVTPQLRLMLKEAFAEIPQRVIWKFNEKVPGLPDNVMVTQWVPQKEILAHPNVVAFISHCGLLSTFEAIDNGKPLILTPIFAEQPNTAARLEELGVGVHWDIMNTSKEKFVELVKEVVNNKEYRDNMRKLSKIIKDNPMTPSKSVAYWTEYVLRHNGALHLRTVAADMPLYQYLLLDVIAFVVALVTIIVYLFVYLIRKIFRILKPPKQKRIEASKKKQ